MKLPHESLSLKQSTNHSSNLQGQNKKKLISYLQATLKEEIQKRQQAQKMLFDYRQRSLKVESEFSRLLEKYDNNIAIARGKETYSQQIWNHLIDEIQNFNDNSERLLEKRCNQILYLMERKINHILEKTEVEIRKTKKLSEEQYHSVKEEIKEALNLSKQIQHENVEIKKINKDLLFKVNILREQKNLLVEELNQKKLLLSKMRQPAWEPSPHSTAILSPRRPRSTKLPFENAKTPKLFFCEPSIKVVSNSIEDPETNRAWDSNSRLKRDKNAMVAKTDNHFKICLEREKRKNAQLKSIVGKLQTRCDQIGSLIQRSWKELQVSNISTQIEKKLQRLIQDVKMKLVLSNGTNRGISQSQKQILSLAQF